MKLSFVTAVAALATTGLALACAASGSTLFPLHHARETLTASAVEPGQQSAYDACLQHHEVIDQSWSATEEFCRQSAEAENPPSDGPPLR